MKQSNKVFHMTVISMFLAILIIQTFVPVLGYIPLGAIDITIVHITVILAAILFGPKTGTIIGASWGLLSMTRSYVQPSITNVFFQKPLISVLPRFPPFFLNDAGVRSSIKALTSEPCGIILLLI